MEEFSYVFHFILFYFVYFLFLLLFYCLVTILTNAFNSVEFLSFNHLHELKWFNSRVETAKQQFFTSSLQSEGGAPGQEEIRMEVLAKYFFLFFCFYVSFLLSSYLYSY